MRTTKFWLVLALALSFAVWGCSSDSGTDNPTDTTIEDTIEQDGVVDNDIVDQDLAIDNVDEDIAIDNVDEDIAIDNVDEDIAIDNVEEDVEDDTVVETNEFDMLISYLEGDGGNYINASAPKVISAADVMSEGLETWTIIDLRSKDLMGRDEYGVFQNTPNEVIDYDEGHIDGAILVAPADLLTYLADNSISDEKLLIVCWTGHLAGHITLYLNVLGYDAYSLGFGMSGWHSDFDMWSGNISSELADQFTTDADTGKHDAGEYPVLNTGKTTAEEILMDRVAAGIEAGTKLVKWADVMAAPDDYYIINYWPEAEYLDPGHFIGSHQYTPKASLATDADLATLPTDKPIAVYCYSGQHGSQVAAWLNILGYEAYDIKFGTNAAIYDQMAAHKWTASADFDYIGMQPVNEFGILLNYLENDGGDYINTTAPKVISATDVLADGLDNWHIIDLRSKDLLGPVAGVWANEPNGTADYEDGHIEGAHLVDPADLLTYVVENITDEKLLVVCWTGHLAGHVTLYLNLLGYDAYSLGFGMSGWNSDFDMWSGNISSDYADQFTTDADTGKNEAGDYPSIVTGYTDAEDILIARIQYMLDNGTRFVKWSDVIAAPDDYYTINYWSEAEYLDPGHFIGSHQYTPKASLRSDLELATLPVDDAIALYCYTGQHGSQAAAWLTILGYDAYDVKFGTNATIYDQMTGHKWTASADLDYVTAE